MAEVVGLVAASGQFIEQSIKIVKLSKKFRDKFNDAPQELEGWREEIDSLRKVVHRIQTTPALQIEDVKPIINQLKDTGGELLKVFNDIGFLEKDSFGHKSWKVAVGLSKEDEIQGLFAKMERLKSTLYIHLSIVNINQNQDDQANLASRMENMTLSFQSGTDEERCLRALFVTDPLSDREGLVTAKGQRTQGTCEWIPKTQRYQDWNAARDGLLWISGSPGKGKTIMSIYLTRLLEESRPDAAVIWFFCDNKAASRNSAVNVLRGLMTQLIQEHPHLISFLLSTWKLQEDGLFRPNSFETLWRILLNMLKALEDKEVCCVLDALDECDEESLSSLLSKLQIFFRQSSGSDARPALKLIITSREQPQCLPNKLSSFPRIILDNLDHDIYLYIMDRVAHLARIKGIQDTPLQFRIEEAFQDGAEGTFLWVSLMAADLEQKTLDEIENALTQLPSGLYSIYERIIGQIKSESRHAISEMLTWILFAKFPLQISQLCDAIQIRPTDTLTREQICFGYVQSCGHLLQFPAQEEDRSAWGASKPPTQVFGQEMCNGILNAHDENIGSFRTTFVHQSVKDFLLSNTIDRSMEFTFDGTAGHATICNRLIELLSQHLSNEVVDQTDTLEQIPLLPYAIRCWSHHMQQLGSDFEVVLRKQKVFFGKVSRARDNWWWQVSAMNRHPYLPKAMPFLHMSCAEDLYHVVKARLSRRNVLLRPKRRSEINRKWHQGNTPLHLAVQNDSIKMVRLLLKHGADVTVENDRSRTPFHMALEAFHDTSEVFDQLCMSGESNTVFLKEAKQYTSRSLGSVSLLHLAAENGNESLCRRLVDKFQYDINMDADYGHPPLHSALRYRHMDLARLMISQWGARLTPPIRLFQAVVLFDSPLGDPLDKCLKIITEDWGCDINATDSDGDTVFQFFAFGFPAMEALQTCGTAINWNHRSKSGDSFLHSEADWLTDARLLYIFLKHAQNGINAVNDSGNTPLHAFIHSFMNLKLSRGNYLGDVRLLLDFGADRFLKNNSGETPSGMAVKRIESLDQGYFYEKTLEK